MSRPRMRRRKTARRGRSSAGSAEHATTRVGPAGRQVAVPVERLEAVTVRHYTSRAGDPHRHLHLQVNARVFAAGKWRGLDTVAFRDSIAASTASGTPRSCVIRNFVPRWPGTATPSTGAGEIEQLALVRRRVLQTRGADRRAAGPVRGATGGTSIPTPSPGRRCAAAWDARAWAEDRPDKVIPRSGDELRQRWLGELAGLGYRDRDKPIQLALQLPGTLDRDAAAVEVVARLGAARSAWNAADMRGEVEQLLARNGLVADAGGARRAGRGPHRPRASQLCVPLRERPTPEHIRALTSRHVLDVEADLVARLAARRGPAGSSAECSVASAAVEGLGRGSAGRGRRAGRRRGIGRGRGRGRCRQDHAARRRP